MQIHPHMLAMYKVNEKDEQMLSWDNTPHISQADPPSYRMKSIHLRFHGKMVGSISLTRLLLAPLSSPVERNK